MFLPATGKGYVVDTDADQQTTISFKEKVFTAVDGSYFRRSDETNEPVFILNLGGEEVMLPFKGIRREFNVEEDSPDDKMLDLVANSLEYVKIVMPGDDIPKEILTGEASWEVTDEHLRVARQRISMQLVSWISGEENLITDPEQLMQIAEDPATQAKINSAFDDAAAALGDEDATKETVIERIEDLARELGYIETLREKFRNVLMAETKVKRIRHLAGKQRSLLDSATSVAQLITKAASEFNDEFEHLDGQTGEIIGVLKNIDSQKEYIRSVRDTLYRRLIAWEDLLIAWDEHPEHCSSNTVDLLRETYRFLAPRYMETDDWALLSKAQQPEDAGKSEVVW